MIWDGISAAVKSLSDNIVAIIKEFHLEPEAALKLEMQAKQQMLDFEKAIWSLETQDRQDARKREIATGDPTVRYLAIAITFAMVAGIAYFTFWPPQPESKEMVRDVMMAVRDGWLIVVAYYFGSSHGSAQKDRVLDRVVNHNAQPSA